MSRPAENWEAQLAEAYELQARHYAAALEVANHLPQALAAGGGEDLLRRLQTEMDQVAAIDRNLHCIKEQWQVSDQPAGPRLKQAVANVAHILQALIPVFASVEHCARESRSALAPQLDAASRGHQMRAAYTSTMKR